MRSNILQEVNLSKVIFHAKKAAGGTPYPSLAAGKLQIQWEVRDVRKQRSVAKKKKHPTTESCNFHLDPQSVWHLSSKGNCHDRLFIIFAIVKSAVNWKKNSLLGCPATPTSSISREINCHGFCTVSLAYSFLVICMSDKENNELPPVFVWCFWYQRCKFHSWSKIQCPTSWLSR